MRAVGTNNLAELLASPQAGTSVRTAAGQSAKAAGRAGPMTGIVATAITDMVCPAKPRKAVSPAASGPAPAKADYASADKQTSTKRGKRQAVAVTSEALNPLVQRAETPKTQQTPKTQRVTFAAIAERINRGPVASQVNSAPSPAADAGKTAAAAVQGKSAQATITQEVKAGQVKSGKGLAIATPPRNETVVLAKAVASAGQGLAAASQRPDRASPAVARPPSGVQIGEDAQPRAAVPQNIDEMKIADPVGGKSVADRPQVAQPAGLAGRRGDSMAAGHELVRASTHPTTPQPATARAVPVPGSPAVVAAQSVGQAAVLREGRQLEAKPQVNGASSRPEVKASGAKAVSAKSSARTEGARLFGEHAMASRAAASARPARTDGAAALHSAVTDVAVDPTAAKVGAEALVAGGARGSAPGAAGQTPAVPVAEQIANAVQAAGPRLERQIVVRLEPPELGKVRVTLRTSGTSVRGVLTADSPETLRRLEHEAPALVQRLQDAGIQMRRLDVVPERHDGGQTFEQPQGWQDGRQQPEYATDTFAAPQRRGPTGQGAATAEFAQAGRPQDWRQSPAETDMAEASGLINVRI
jgi:flagellar hook-length control protein FliK